MADTGELKRLLSRLRERTSREEVGLPPLRPGRPGVRAKGLTQGAVDTLLGWPSGTYQRLESGRQQRIREDQLDDLGDLFQLSDAEYVEMYVLALGKRPRRTRHPEADITLPSLAAWQQMVDMFPEPAYVTNLEGDLVAANTAFSEVFASGKAPQNLIRWTLFAQEARQSVLVDWSTAWAPECIRQL
ncbi:helix-turn-helix domain-containing protein, partial [Streptomyces sp. NPDC001939]